MIIMLDIETASAFPNAAILSISAVALDENFNEVDHFYDRIKYDPDDTRFHTEQRTLNWWSEQDAAVREEAFSGTSGVDEIIPKFSNWVEKIGPTEIWAKPPSFDIVIIESAMRALGIETPWHYRAPRCLRTIVALTGVTESAPAADAHNALSDARTQVETLKRAFEVAV